MSFLEKPESDDYRALIQIKAFKQYYLVNCLIGDCDERIKGSLHLEVCPVAWNRKANQLRRERQLR